MVTKSGDRHYLSCQFFVIFAALKKRAMAQIKKIGFVLKSEKNPNKPALISVRYTWDKRYTISLGEKCAHSCWNKHTLRPTYTNEMPRSQQRALAKLEKKLDVLEAEISRKLVESHYYEKNARSGEIIKEGVVRAIAKFKGEEKKEKAFLAQTPTEYFEKIVADMPNKIVNGTKISSGTLTNHRIALKRYKEFVNKRMFRDSFDNFNREFENKFRNYFIVEKGQSPNTVMTTIANLKSWLNHIEKDGKIKLDSCFHSWKSKGEKVQSVYLTPIEVNRIYDIQFTPELKEEWNINFRSNIEQSRDYFIIACRTGLRLSDLGRLNTFNWDIEERVLMAFQKKTKAYLTIPLASQVIELYNKYNGQFPKLTDKSKYNRDIQKICRIAGIDNEVNIVKNVRGEIENEKKKKWEMVTSHTARRSFATNLYEILKNPYKVMYYTGHKTPDNFFKYIQYTQEDFVESVRSAFDY